MSDYSQKCIAVTRTKEGLIKHICGLKLWHSGKHRCRDCGDEFVRTSK